VIRLAIGGAGFAGDAPHGKRRVNHLIKPFGNFSGAMWRMMFSFANISAVSTRARRFAPDGFLAPDGFAGPAEKRTLGQ